MEIMDREDWSYTKLSPFAGEVDRSYAENLYELVIERKSALQQYQPIFWTYPELQEYRTKDLFSKHPTKPDLWLWQGRIDDIIVLSNGEKFNPIKMEDMILNGHPAIEAALVCGQGHVQCALLVELSSNESSEDDKDEQELVEELWPAIQEANESIPEYGRLMKDMVIVAKQGKRMIRADKGTIQRKRTLEHFAAELEQLYRVREGPNMTCGDFHPRLDFTTAKQIITKIVQQTQRYQTIQPSASFFGMGLDSLRATVIASRLRAACSNSSVPITTKTVYDNPSIDRLAGYVCGLGHPEKDNTKAMETLYDRYLPTRLSEPSLLLSPKLEKSTVVLVGSTGHLGQQLLARLLLDPSVGTIYCLNRDKNAEARQSELRVKLGIEFPKTIRYIHADYEYPVRRLGLDEHVYGKMQRNITHVILNAWPVDFCMPLSGFEHHIRATAQLMDLCASAEHKVLFTFISTIGAAIKSSGSVVYEEVIADWAAAEDMGYTQTKLVAERLVSTHSAVFGIKSVICRVGQLGGVSDTTQLRGWSPSWPEKQWVPTMLAASKQLGVIPSALAALNKVDWLPVDVAAAVVCELVFAADDNETMCQVFHVVNPHSVAWSSLLPSLKSWLDLERVSFTDWVARLKPSIEDKPDGNVAAAGLVDFFESACQNDSEIPEIDVSKAKARSLSLQHARPINADLMERWIRQWGFGQ